MNNSRLILTSLIIFGLIGGLIWYFYGRISKSTPVVQTTNTVTIIAGPQETAALTAGNLTAVSGSSIDVPVILAPASFGISAIQFDMPLSNGLVYVSTSAGAAAVSADKSVQSNLIGNTVKVIVFGLNQTSINSGIVATVRLTVNNSASINQIPLVISGIVASGVNNELVNIVGVNGTLMVTP